jgi:dual specificity MAP kinase phosphatase
MAQSLIIIDTRPLMTYSLEYVKDSYNLHSTRIHIMKYQNKSFTFFDMFTKSDEVKEKLEKKYFTLILYSETSNKTCIEIAENYLKENEIEYEKKLYDEYIKTISEDLIVKYIAPKKQMVIAMSPNINCFGVLSEIIPGLYLSGIECIPSEISNTDITNVISVLNEPPTFTEKYNHMKIQISDTHSQNIEKYFEKTHKFIDEALEKKEKVLVHCFAGISRSATIVISYLMKKNKIDMNTAYNMVKKIRPCVSPNFWFFASLHKFEKEIL